MRASRSFPFRPRWFFAAAFTVIGLAPALNPLFTGTAAEVLAAKSKKPTKSSAVVATAQRYLESVAVGDQLATGRQDFACLFRLVAGGTPVKAFPPDSSPYYRSCWEQLTEAHRSAVEHREQWTDAIWPGKGALVFFREGLSTYVPSYFVMDLLGHSPPAGGLKVEALDSAPLPPAAFKLRDDGKMLAAPATLVRLRVTYKDPLLSPIAFAPGAYKFASTVKRPRSAIKAVTVRVVVLSRLKKLGFPADQAVVNLPVRPATASQPPVPFLTEYGRYEKDSVAYWGAEDAPGVLIAAVGRAALLPDLRDRVAMVNRVLIVDPMQPDALTLLARDLYDTILAEGTTAHRVKLPEGELANRFDELYWDIYAQTTRTDLSLGMEMGGFQKPTPADYLYRMIPAMEKLAKIRPEDLGNRFRLVRAYRWNNDQLRAIEAAEALVKQTPETRPQLRAQALLELAWSRIHKVSWNRIFDDPNIQDAYREAQEAAKLADRPLEKFTTAYTLAYSLAFMPKRDNQAMLAYLTEAQKWYREVPGATVESWHYLLVNDTLTGVLHADDIFKPLLASSGEQPATAGAQPSAH